MKKELSVRVVPILRARGFTGTLPHFRRISGSKVDLLSFQFDKHSGGFVLNLAIGPADGFTTHWGRFIPVEKLDPSYDLGITTRIQPGQSGSADGWFRYDRLPNSSTENVYETVAKEVVFLLEKADKWFAQFQTWTKPNRPIVSSEEILRRKYLFIVAKGEARMATKDEILRELMEAGVPSEKAAEVYEQNINQLQNGRTNRPWWKFWR